MYEYISGKLVYANPTFCVIDCYNIGYKMQISVNTYAAVKDLQEVKLFVHHVVREDEEMLFGFYEENERTMFRNLITVSGVGVNTARIILSSLTVSELYATITEGNYQRLKSVKGIGEKTSQRIVVDLKDKLAKIDFNLDKNLTWNNNNVEEALSALSMLGFPKPAVEKAIRKIIAAMGDNMSVEELVKETLKIM